MRLAIIIAALLALAAPVHATEIGEAISFESPTIGCVSFDDAKEALRLRNAQGLRRAQSFARQKRDRCASLDNPGHDWLVVNTYPSQWLCVEYASDYDVHSQAERKKARAEPRPCWWVSACAVGKPPADRPTTPYSPVCGAAPTRAATARTSDMMCQGILNAIGNSEDRFRVGQCVFAIDQYTGVVIDEKCRIGRPCTVRARIKKDARGMWIEHAYEAAAGGRR
jgi:hypothetical protein